MRKVLLVVQESQRIITQAHCFCFRALKLTVWLSLSSRMNVGLACIR